MPRPAAGEAAATTEVDARNTRPKGMPYNPRHTSVSPFVQNFSEGDLAALEVIRKAIALSPEVRKKGYSVNKTSASSAIYQAGLVALAAELGVNIDAALATEQDAFDAWDAANPGKALTYFASRKQ